jgi:hypothetical protein
MYLKGKKKDLSFLSSYCSCLNVFFSLDSVSTLPRFKSNLSRSICCSASVGTCALP